MDRIVLPFRRDVLKLKRFGGELSDDQVRLTGIQGQLRKLLDRAVTELPLFAGNGFPDQKQIQNYYQFLSPTAPAPHGWEKIDKTPYRRMIADLQDWLDKEAKTAISPEAAVKARLNERVRMLVGQLVLEAQKQLGLLDGMPGSRAAAARLELKSESILEAWQRNGKLMMLTKEAPPADAATPLGSAQKTPNAADSLETALFAYAAVAARHNPLLDDLDKDLNAEEYQKRLNFYEGDETNEAEAAARDAALQALLAFGRSGNK